MVLEHENTFLFRHKHNNNILLGAAAGSSTARMVLKSWRLCSWCQIRSSTKGILDRARGRFPKAYNRVISIEVSPSSRRCHRVAGMLSPAVWRRSGLRGCNVRQRRSVDYCRRWCLAKAGMAICAISLGAVGLGGTMIMGFVHIRTSPRIILWVIHGWSKLLGRLLRGRRLLLLRRNIFWRCLRRLRGKFSDWR
jgi:hypothetical protein